MIKVLNYEYGFMATAECKLKLDTEKFSKDDAQMLLDFFSWDYDEEVDPVDEYMKKVAMKCIKVATFGNYSLQGVISEFEDLEGWPRMDGSNGITLLDVTMYEFDEDDLTLKEE